MLKKILIALVLILGGFAAVVATRPAVFHIERSGTMKASAAVAFDLVNDFHAWAQWSPWDKTDPAMKRTYSGPPSGVGSAYAWVGNDKVGEGSMAIMSAQPPEKIVIKLEFLKPSKATNTTTFSFKEAGDTTTVSWSMDGQNDFMGKAFSMFMNMDQMIGGDFERGLASMKTLAEAEAVKRAEKAAADKAAADKAAADKAAADKAAADAAAAAPPAKNKKKKK